MVILIEGNEGVGKTSLINALQEHLTFISVKYSKHFMNPYGMFSTMAKSSDLYVVDRGFVSDMVYRAIDGECPHTTLREIVELCERDVKIVFCYNDNAFENAIKRGETNIVSKEVHDKINEYFYFTEKLLRLFTPIETISYDWALDDVTDVVKFIKGGER